ncbi:MAG: CDP-alcohol phosphatidyltransferase family protein [Pseudomonadota bacterium]
MLDGFLRRRCEPLVTRLARPFGQMPPNGMTAVGLGFAVLAALAIAHGAYFWGLLAFLANRLADVLDGALARAQNRVSVFGGYVDIVMDMIAYGAIVWAFAWADPAHAVAAAWLLLSYMGTCASYLAWPVTAVGERPPRSLAESVETTIYVVLVCCLPGSFAMVSYGFSVLCWLTVIHRLIAARRMNTERTDHGG